MEYIVSTTDDAVQVHIQLPLDAKANDYSVEVILQQDGKRTLSIHDANTGQPLINVPLLRGVSAEAAATKYKRSKDPGVGPKLIFTAPLLEDHHASEGAEEQLEERQDAAAAYAAMFGAELLSLGHSMQEHTHGQTDASTAAAPQEPAHSPSSSQPARSGATLPAQQASPSIPAPSTATPPPASAAASQPKSPPVTTQPQAGATSAAVPTPTSAADPATGVALAETLDCTNLSLMLSTASVKAGLHAAGGGSTKKNAKAERKKVSSMLDAIAHSLETKGWAVCDNYVPIELVIAVRKEVKVMEPHFTEGEVWVGKEAGVGATITRKDVRGDVVLWLDEQALTATSFVKDGVQKQCNFGTLHTVLRSIDRLVTGELPQRSPRLAHVRERSDAMMAIYPGHGARFARHIDNTADDGRRLTLLCYLNPNWKQQQGGMLRLTPPDGPVVDIYPEAGRLAMFLSKTVAHEVMPTAAPRYSFTLWYYDALERAEAIATAKVAAGGTGSTAAQMEARNLVRDILAGGGDMCGDQGIQATEQGVVSLKVRVARMTTSALSIVAAITGAPSTQAFVDAVQAMSPDDITHLREELSSMGLAGQAHNPQPLG